MLSNCTIANVYYVFLFNTQNLKNINIRICRYEMRLLYVKKQNISVFFKSFNEINMVVTWHCMHSIRFDWTSSGSN